MHLLQTIRLNTLKSREGKINIIIIIIIAKLKVIIIVVGIKVLLFHSSEIVKNLKSNKSKQESCLKSRKINLIFRILKWNDRTAKVHSALDSNKMIPRLIHK